MTKASDRSLDDMRKENDEEVEAMVIEEEELAELDAFEAKLTTAHALSGEPPSRAAIEYVEESVSLPERQPADYGRFNAAVRARIDKALREQTGAESIGAWVQRERRRASIAEERAARDAGVALPAYRLFEAGRMPVWRLPATSFARLCRELALDVRTVIRWAAIAYPAAQAGVYGRLDVTGDEGSEALGELAKESAKQSEQEYERWRQEFIEAVSGGSSGDDARRER